MAVGKSLGNMREYEVRKKGREKFEEGKWVRF
jgi:hypothetical protein